MKNPSEVFFISAEAERRNPRGLLHRLASLFEGAGGLEIKTVGVAMKTGFKNDVIPVRNERSKKTYRGRLVGAGEVLVESKRVLESPIVDAAKDRRL